MSRTNMATPTDTHAPESGHASISESEEMYLNTIACIEERGVEGPVPLSQLAEQLAVLPVSANQMIRKLAERGWVTYQPYKGVALTADGRRIAARVLRSRRLWQVFLVEHLQLETQTADALACRMEHITPPIVADRLDAYLGHPHISPQGRPIPGEDAPPLASPQVLASLAQGAAATVAQLAGDAATLAFFGAEGVRVGKPLRVCAIDHRGGVLVEHDSRHLYLVADLAAQLFVNLAAPQEEA